jgi:hypothetical protein
MAITIQDLLTGAKAGVDLLSKALRISSYDTKGNKLTFGQRELLPATQEYQLIAGKNDQVATAIRTDRKGNILTGNYTPEFTENFEGIIVNAQKWNVSTLTFGQTQSSSQGYNLTATGATGSGNFSIATSQRNFLKLPRVPLQFKARLRQSALANSVIDFGFGAAINTQFIVQNAVIFRMTSSAVVQGVINFNGGSDIIGTIKSQVSSNGNTIGGDLNMSNSYYTNNYFVYDIIIDDDNAVFTIQDTSTGELIGMLTLPVPISTAKMIGIGAVPVYYRALNTSTTTASPILIVAEMQVLSLDWNVSIDASQNAANLSASSGRQPFSGAQLENHTNSTAPVSATLSNTAAGYTTLGGKFQFAGVAGSATDYCLFGYQVPAGSKFMCEGVRIETRNTGVAVATTPTTLEWAMGFNSSAVTLGNANIKKQVGTQSLPNGSAVEATAPAIDINFVTPEVTESGRFVQVILTIPVGTATASQIIRGQVLVKGRFI